MKTTDRDYEARGLVTRRQFGAARRRHRHGAAAGGQRCGGDRVRGDHYDARRHGRLLLRASGDGHGARCWWPDIFGLRPAFRQMGKRLAESGYSVLVVNPFYRTKKAPTAPNGAATPIPELTPLAAR